MREQNSGANVGKRFAAQPIFSLEIVGADEGVCSGSVLQERAAGASSLVCTGLTPTLLLQSACVARPP